jgi:sulfatase maturation enzyme AslB (radical SAM superfamily)
MRLLSALFLLPQNGGNRKCQTCLVRSLSAGQCSGDWGMPTNKRSPFVQKDTACQYYLEFGLIL